jgi:hypothetical protein
LTPDVLTEHLLGSFLLHQIYSDLSSPFPGPAAIGTSTASQNGGGGGGDGDEGGLSKKQKEQLFEPIHVFGETLVAELYAPISFATFSCL